mmetsp:Transcript_9710/g.14925  ORF Transcript_9710/g.14925 Transcript_9710/m.14925 type:complete len:223 (+) Transcript_9710:316-984(+)
MNFTKYSGVKSIIVPLPHSFDQRTLGHFLHLLLLLASSIIKVAPIHQVHAPNSFSLSEGQPAVPGPRPLLAPRVKAVQAPVNRAVLLVHQRQPGILRRVAAAAFVRVPQGFPRCLQVPDTSVGVGWAPLGQAEPSQGGGPDELHGHDEVPGGRAGVGAGNHSGALFGRAAVAYQRLAVVVRSCRFGAAVGQQSGRQDFPLVHRLLGACFVGGHPTAQIIQQR